MFRKDFVILEAKQAYVWLIPQKGQLAIVSSL